MPQPPAPPISLQVKFQGHKRFLEIARCHTLAGAYFLADAVALAGDVARPIRDPACDVDGRAPKEFPELPGKAKRKARRSA